MGYDSTLIVGTAHTPGPDGAYLRVIATYDLATLRDDPYRQLVADSPETDCYLYDGPIGGNFSDDDVEQAADNAGIPYSDALLELVQRFTVGNHQTSQDAYGARLRELDLDTTIDVLEAAIDPTDPYRRIPPVLALLLMFQTYRKAFDGPGERLVVLHYGH